MITRPTFEVIILVLFAINILNFLDRGIIPGASEEFNLFITNSGITSNQNAFLGLLQSAFIIGYSIAALIFGHASHHYPPFSLCTYGMSAWIVAIFFSGFSYYTSSYTCLIFARMLSGVGEAAFQISIPPWISKYAPPHQRGMYLSLYFTAIPVGTAIGYAYSAAIATTIGWQFCFFIEAIAMIFFIPFLIHITPLYPSVRSSSINDSSKIGPTSNSSALSLEDDVSQQLTAPLVEIEALISQRSIDSLYDTPVEYDNSNNASSSSAAASEYNDGREQSSSSSTTLNQQEPNFIEEIQILLNIPTYLCIVAGFAAQAASMVGISTFGSAFLIGLGYFETEVESSSTFGALVCLAGITSTPLGGVFIDYLNTQRKRVYDEQQWEEFIHMNASPNKSNLHHSKHTKSVEERTAVNKSSSNSSSNILFNINQGSSRFSAKNKAKVMELLQLQSALSAVTIVNFIGACFFCFSYFIQTEAWFLYHLFLGAFFIFFSASGVNMSVMLSVPECHRPLAMGFAILGLHVFGDVPSPVIAGLLKDYFAPSCSLSATSSSGDISNTYHQQVMAMAMVDNDTGSSSSSSNSIPINVNNNNNKSRIMNNYVSNLISKISDYSSSSSTYTSGGSNSDECRAENDGLRLTLLLVSSWLFVCVFFMALAWYLAMNHHHQYQYPLSSQQQYTNTNTSSSANTTGVKVGEYDYEPASTSCNEDDDVVGNYEAPSIILPSHNHRHHHHSNNNNTKVSNHL